MQLLYGINIEIWVVSCLAITALLLLLWITAIFNIRKLRKRLQLFVKETGVDNLEGVMAELHERTERMRDTVQRQQETIERMEKKLADFKGNVSIVRYNAFEDRGSDLSFSLAIVSEKQDGVVVSTIHARDESMVYAKPIEGGQSSYPLTPEEKEAISRALRPKETAAGAR